MDVRVFPDYFKHMGIRIDTAFLFNLFLFSGKLICRYCFLAGNIQV